MKVKDLIKKLSAYDKDLEVLIADWSEGYEPPSKNFREYIIKVSNDEVKLDKNMTFQDMRKVMVFIYEFFKMLEGETE